MRHLKNIRLCSSFAVLLAVFQVQAIGISSMLEYTNEHGEATFTVSNTDGYRQYINTAVSELVVERGDIRKIPYTRDNVDSWVLDVRPARTIVEAGFKKMVSIKYQPQQKLEQLDRDRVFQISFVPTPYFAEGEKERQVKIAFGFAPLLIVPAKKTQPLLYELQYTNGYVRALNKGRGFFSLYLDGCPKGTSDTLRKECSVQATVLSGRELKITLPKGVSKNAELRAKMFSYGNRFTAEEVLVKKS